MSARRGGGGGISRTVLIALAVTIIASSTVIPAGSFTTATVDRNSTIEVAEDTAAIIGLGVNSTVRIGNTDEVVNVTNNVNRDLEVTVTLSSHAADGDIVVNGTNYGDSATFTLSPTANESVEVDVATDCSLDGKTLTYDLDGNTSAFNGTAPRSTLMEAPTVNRTHVAYQDPNTNEHRLIDRSGAVTNFSHIPNSFGAPSADYDCDGRMEVPYVDGDGKLVIVDTTGERQTLLSGGIQNGSRLGVSDLDADDKPEILYANTSDSNTIYRVENGESPVKVANVTAYSLTNPGDISGDGDDDIVFTDSTGSVKYYDNATVYDTTVVSDDSRYVGDPIDFSGDGEVRVPYIENRRLKLTDKDGNTEKISSGADTVTGSMASFDYDEDGNVEVVFRDESDGWIKHVELYGKMVTISDENGNDVKGDINGTA